MEKKEQKKSVFDILSAIDCSKHIEKKKQGNTELSYLSWAWAWHICKEHFPEATYTIYETPEGMPYWTDGRTCWVKTGVTIEGLEYKEYLPVMDYRNQSIPLDKITSMDMNKAIQRSLTKCLGRHGLGLYVYAGEDLPYCPEEGAKEEQKPQQATLEEIEDQNKKDEDAFSREIAATENQKALSATWKKIQKRFGQGSDPYNRLEEEVRQKNRYFKALIEAAKKQAQQMQAQAQAQPQQTDLGQFNFINTINK